jgi:hypothetical protein
MQLDSSLLSKRLSTLLFNGRDYVDLQIHQDNSCALEKERPSIPFATEDAHEQRTTVSLTRHDGRIPYIIGSDIFFCSNVPLQCSGSDEKVHEYERYFSFETNRPEHRA